MRDLEEIYSIISDVEILFFENLDKLDEEAKKFLKENLEKVLKLLKEKSLDTKELKGILSEIKSVISEVSPEYKEERSQEIRHASIKALSTELADKSEGDKIIEIKNRSISLVLGMLDAL